MTTITDIMLTKEEFTALLRRGTVWIKEARGTRQINLGVTYIGYHEMHDIINRAEDNPDEDFKGIQKIIG